jgi:hypothetical protein
MSGANCIYAEAGANPRDTQTKTEQSRGLNLQNCEELLLECGFSSVILPTGKEAPLSGYDLQTYTGISQIPY